MTNDRPNDSSSVEPASDVAPTLTLVGDDDALCTDGVCIVPKP